MINLFCIRPKGFNVGNDAIFLGLRHFIYRSFGEVVNLISLPATSRYESHARAGLSAKNIYEINQYGHGVIIGGGNLYENGELDVDTEALKSLDVPLMVFSVSRGRIYNRRLQLVDRTDGMPDRMMQAIDQKATLALWRDTATANYLKSIGCRHTAIGGCPTIFLDRIANELPHVPGDYSETALISVRVPNLMSIPLEKQAQVTGDIRQIIDLLRSHGIRDVRLLCHDHRDIPFAATFSDISYVYTGDIYSYLAMLRRCAMNVSYRLHSFLPCLAFNRPAIKISYDERAISLIDTIGLGDWNINMIHEPQVVDSVESRLRSLPQLSRMRQQLQPRWQQNYELFHGTLRQFAAQVQEYHRSVNRTTIVLPQVRRAA